MFVRNSKFRHVFGLPAKKDQCYEGFKPTKTAHDGSICAVNPWFIAVAVESSGGGTFIVVPLKKKGRVGPGYPRVCGHSGPVTDLKWNPFDPSIIASSSEDSLVRLWQIPPTGLLIDLSEPLCELEGHTKRVTQIEWHPTASNILLSISTDLQCILWSTEDASIVNSISVHPDIILSISWNRTGSLFASICKDKRIRVIDPRRGTVVAEGEGHEGSKSAKVVFLGDTNRLFTTGYSRGSQRQVALWNANDLSYPIKKEDIDSSSGLLIPYFDPDTGIVFLAGKGDGNIRYYEILAQKPYMTYLNHFQSSIPQCGVAMMPKYGVDPYKCEIVRFYKLHTTKDICEPISMIAPRKSDGFQEDIFPPTAAPEPVLTAKEWLQGKDAEPKLISMKDIGDTLAGLFPFLKEESCDYYNAKKSKHDILKSAQKSHWSNEAAKQTSDEESNDAKENKKNDDKEWKGTVKSNIGKFELQYSIPQELQRGLSTVSETENATSAASDTPTVKTSFYQMKMVHTNESPAQNGLQSKLKRNTSEDISDNATRVPSYQTTLLRRTTMMSTLSDADPRSPRPGYDKHIPEQRFASGTNMNGGVTWQDTPDGDMMLDTILTDAPDDTLIKPSLLRMSMRSQSKSTDKPQDAFDNSLMYRRATSLRERTVSGKHSQRDWPKTRSLSQESNTRKPLQIYMGTDPEQKMSMSNDSGNLRQQTSQEDLATNKTESPQIHRLNRQDYVKFRSSSKDQGKQNFDRFSWPPNTRSQENESLNQDASKATGKMSNSANWHPTDNHQRRDGEYKQEDENKNWKGNLNHVDSPGTAVRKDLRRAESVRQEQMDTPADYTKLLSKYLGQTEEIKQLKDGIFMRDKTIERLEKQLRHLLHLGLVVPPPNP